jgi:hypothetical protein
VNLVLSIILVQRSGLAGVFMGTLVSSIVLPCWQRPYIVCKYALKTSSKGYFIKYAQYLITIIAVTLLISKILDVFLIGGKVIDFIVKLLICTVIPNVTFLLLFRKTKEFKYVLSIAEKILGR